MCSFLLFFVYILDTFLEINTSSSDESNVEDEEFDKPGPSTKCFKQTNRGNINFITSKLAAALDKCKISDRDAVHILISTAEALVEVVNKLIINRTSIRNARLRFRKERAENIRKEYKLSIDDAVILHWDGKLLPALTGQKDVDRLPTVVSCNGIDQLLGVPAIDTGTGLDQADAIFHMFNDWCITENVQAFCCDTTASNTGRIKGSCVSLENYLKRNILYLPCRHHIYELVLKNVFDTK